MGIHLCSKSALKTQGPLAKKVEAYIQQVALENIVVPGFQ